MQLGSLLKHTAAVKYWSWLQNEFETTPSEKLLPQEARECEFV